SAERQSPGLQVTLTWTATNCTPEAEDITAVVEGTTFGPIHVLPGQSATNTKTVPMPQCPPPGTGSVTFHGNASAVNQCANYPPATASSQCDVACIPAPCVEFDLKCSSDRQCTGLPVTLTWTATNCSPEAEDITAVVEGPTCGPIHVLAGHTASDTKTVPMPQCPPARKGGVK